MVVRDVQDFTTSVGRVCVCGIALVVVGLSEEETTLTFAFFSVGRMMIQTDEVDEKIVNCCRRRASVAKKTRQQEQPSYISNNTRQMQTSQKEFCNRTK